jgi:hypothetical protein
MGGTASSSGKAGAGHRVTVKSARSGKGFTAHTESKGESKRLAAAITKKGTALKASGPRIKVKSGGKTLKTVKGGAEKARDMARDTTRQPVSRSTLRGLRKGT